ncbi:hypothetical protein C1H46_045756 [Malus baccata]|uniref:Uncharacterized protein n=1 Tax=Malus baccata TaxID=106549 RepID=A0A540K389_MALBA|nr:hypothetical protein C1H46_045756 [Malus baccata]
MFSITKNNLYDIIVLLLQSQLTTNTKAITKEYLRSSVYLNVMEENHCIGPHQTGPQRVVPYSLHTELNYTEKHTLASKLKSRTGEGTNRRGVK